MSKKYNKLRDMAEAKNGAEKLFPGIAKSTSYQVDPRLLEFEPGFNARPIDREHVDELKQSIKAGAQIPDLFVKIIDNRLIVRDGHHRATAYQECIAEGLDIKTVGVKEFVGNDADAILLMITSAKGKPLLPLEAGLQYAKLIKLGWMNKQIADHIGKSTQHVADMLILANANSDVQRMIKDGTVAAHVALKTQRKHGADTGKVLKEHLAKVKTTGKKKLTNKTVAVVTEKAKPTLTDSVNEFLYKMMNDKSLPSNYYYAGIILHNYRIGNINAPAPDLEPVAMTLQDAIRMEMETGVMAETLVPEYADLIVHLRAKA